jgi:hypothetical protein
MCALLLIAGCGGDGSPDTTSTQVAPTTEATTTTQIVATTTTEATTTTQIVATTTTEATTTEATTTVASTTTLAGPTTTQVASTTTSSSLVCPSIGGRDDVTWNFPGGLSALVGVDIRTGGHECFDRIVIEFATIDPSVAATPPGYWIRYTDDPITLGQTDDQFVDVAGAAHLLVTVEAWMYSVDADGDPVGYAGPIDLFPTNVSTIREIRMIDNFEGVQVWAVGLDRERDLRVTTLTQPQRLVIDLGR